MAKTKISEFSTTAGNNTDINSINIAEGCAPSGINDAIRELMRQLKEFQTGGAGDSVNSGGDFSVATNKFTVASASGNTSVAGTLGVTGTTTLTGALVANGNATLGDASGDTVTIKGTPTLEVNPTLSGGTANGVLYLNGSKVATSGSALTYDGTTFTVTRASAYNTRFAYDAPATYYTDIGYGGTNTVAPSNPFYYFSLNGSEAMRLTSTGLGVGTSSPGQKLHVVGDGNFARATATDTYIQASNSVATFNITQSANGSTYLYNYGAYNLYFGTGAATKMTLDSSGNLGLGVTPSAWRTSEYKAVQVGVGASFYGRVTAGDEDKAGFSANAFYDQTDNRWEYIATDSACKYDQAGGGHYWYTAASGTAGAAITFSQVMTLDASGNLLVGTTSVSNSSKQTIGFVGSTTNGLSVDDTEGTTTSVGYVNFSRSGTSKGSITYNNGTGLVSYNSTSDYRAKDISGPVINSGALIDSVPVYMGKMKGATQERPMFIAHETPAYAHTGEKDAVDAKGNPVYQQMDASALIPVMWAEIQSLRARVAALES